MPGSDRALEDNEPDGEFDERLSGLRKELARVQAGNREGRTRAIASHIRHISWVLSALAFVVALNLRAEDLSSELPRAVSFAVIAALVVIGIAELAIQVLRKSMK